MEIYLWFANIFSQSIGCLFILFMVSFAVQLLLNLVGPYFKIFVFISIAVEGGSKKNIIDLCQCSAFSSGSFRVSGPTFRSLSLLSLLLCVILRVFQFHSFPCSCPVFSAAFIEEIVFSPLYILLCCRLTIRGLVYFWTFHPVPLINICFSARTRAF